MGGLWFLKQLLVLFISQNRACHQATLQLKKPGARRKVLLSGHKLRRDQSRTPLSTLVLSDLATSISVCCGEKVKFDRARISAQRPRGRDGSLSVPQVGTVHRTCPRADGEDICYSRGLEIEGLGGGDHRLPLGLLDVSLCRNSYSLVLSLITESLGAGLRPHSCNGGAQALMTEALQQSKQLQCEPPSQALTKTRALTHVEGAPLGQAFTFK